MEVLTYRKRPVARGYDPHKFTVPTDTELLNEQSASIAARSEARD